MVSPAGLGQVDGSVAGPVLRDHLGADPEGPGAGDALHRHVAPLRDHGAAVPEGELGGLLAEVALASDGGVLLVKAPGHDILLGLRRQRRSRQKFRWDKNFGEIGNRFSFNLVFCELEVH